MTDRAADERRTACTLPLFLMGQIVGILLGRMMASPWLAMAALAASFAACLLLGWNARLAALTLLAFHPAAPEEFYQYSKDIAAVLFKSL